ncbi:hypothetical protein ANO11243_066450 [Dothideomycetidae sp. 11243]|nr:hypothetical protein ANO11243_066450 [fungal sp. No.11243]
MYAPRYSQPYYSTSYQYQATPQSTQYYAYGPPPAEGTSSRHRRRATADGTYAHAYPQAGYYYAPPEESKPRRSSSHRHREHVSSSDRHHRSHSKRQSYGNANDASGQYQYRSGEQYYSYPSQSAYYARPGGYAGPGDEYTSAYERKYRVSPPPMGRQSYSYPGAYADGYAYRAQDPIFAEAHTSSKKKARRASHGQPQPSYQNQQGYQPQPQQSYQAQPATEADARRAGIPAGFSFKHWDPAEEPILLLGSVFDSYSLGKWIYDWTVACHGSNTPLAEVAGDLWLLLIQLAGFIKRSEAKLRFIRHKDDKEMIEDFLDSGERLWARFSKLLKICESSMLKAAKKKSGSKKVVVGKDSGVVFIKCIFGRDHELKRTEKIMAGMNLWIVRFNANCNSILQNV